MSKVSKISKVGIAISIVGLIVAIMASLFNQKIPAFSSYLVYGGFGVSMIGIVSHASKNKNHE